MKTVKYLPSKHLRFSPSLRKLFPTQMTTIYMMHITQEQEDEITTYMIHIMHEQEDEL